MVQWKNKGLRTLKVLTSDGLSNRPWRSRLVSKGMVEEVGSLVNCRCYFIFTCHIYYLSSEC